MPYLIKYYVNVIKAGSGSRVGLFTPFMSLNLYHFTPTLYFMHSYNISSEEVYIWTWPSDHNSWKLGLRLELPGKIYAMEGAIILEVFSPHLQYWSNHSTKIDWLIIKELFYLTYSNDDINGLPLGKVKSIWVRLDLYNYVYLPRRSTNSLFHRLLVEQ